MFKKGILKKLAVLLIIFSMLSGMIPGWNFGVGKVYAEGEQVITNFEGDLTTEHTFIKPVTPFNTPDAARAVYTGEQIGSGDESTRRNYFVRKFVPSVTGQYTVEVTDAQLSDGDDTYMLIYKDSFDSENPLVNVLAGNDDKPNSGDYTSGIPDQNLTAGKGYYIVVTSFGNGSEGHISFSITGPGSVTVSDPATAAVPAIETQPQDVTISEGNILILNVKASASDGGTLSYQWQKSVDSGSTWGNIAGATGSTYITGALAAGDSGTSFRCVVTNTKGGSAASATTTAASVTVNVSDTPDTAAPTFAEGPAVDADAVYITLTASLNESGTIYYLAVPKDSAAPTSSEVIAGVPYGNITPIASGSQPASDAPYSQTIYIKGLKEKTEYDVYVVAADDENSPNVMAVPVKLSTKTTENNALQFDEDSTVTGLSGISPAEFTLEFKLNTGDNSSGMKQDIYRGKDSDGHDVAIGLTYFIIEMNGDGSCIYAPQLSISVGDNSYTAGAVLSSYNGWLHVAITSSQTSGTTLYINGKSYVQLDDPIKLPVSDVQMGTDFVFEDHEYPTFNIDDFQIWDKEKTADEIKADMNSELLPPFSQHLVRYYDFNRGIGLGDNRNPPVNTLPDKLGNGIGTLANFDLIGYLSNWIKIILNSTVNPTSVTFDKNTANTSEGHYQDEVLTLTLNGNTLYDVKLNGASIGNGNYTLSGNTLTLKKEYLSTLTTGTKLFTMDMSEGFDPKVTVTVIDTSAPVKAPGFSPEPDPGPGTEPGTTGIPGVTPVTGNHLLVKVSSSIIATPNTGDAAPTGTGVIDPYTAGSDIPGVDAVVNKYIGLYEADSSNKVVKFKLIVLGTDDINPWPTTPVPEFSPVPDPGPGTEPGTTGIPGVTPVTGNHLLVKVSSSIIATPNTGDAAPTGTGVIDPYTAGSDIPGVDAVVNKYIGLYEADSSNKVVKFKLIVLGTDDINPWPTTPVPEFSPEPDPGPGTEPGTTGIPGVTPVTGNHLLVKVSSSIIATPNTGDAAPTGTGVIDPYTAGSDIPGVDAVVNKYIGLYEADSSNKVVKFKLIVLGTDDINPWPTTPVPEFSPVPDPGPGTEPGTTGIPGVTPVTGNHLLVKVSSSIIATPNTGDATPTGTGVIDPYTAGSDIPGADAVVNKYIGLYEVDDNNMVVKFKLIVLGTEDINPWPTNPVPEFSPEPDPIPGKEPGTTAIPDVTTGSGIRLLVKVSSEVIATPNIGDTAPTGAGVIDPYTAGSDIPGVDAVVNKYIGLYEIDDNNRVIKFLLITLTYEDINSAIPVNVPGIPTGVTAVAGNGQATVSFTAPADNGGSPITGYIVTSSPGNITATGTGTTITVTGLTNGITYTFTVKAVNAVGNSAESAASNAVTPYSPSSGGSSGGGSGGGSAPSTPTTVTGPTKPAETGVEILVNGRGEIAATAKTTKEGDKSVITITVDDKKVAEKLEREGKNTVVTIPVKTEADVIIGKINGQTVKNMENKEAVLEIKTNNVVYSIPASQINIDAVSAQIGREVQLEDISIGVRIAASSKDTLKLAEETAAKNNYQLVVNPVDFEITCTNNSKTVEVSRFNVFVKRMVAIPEGIDPNKITTGVVIEPDGTSRHVPTRVTVENGRYYAVINSLTNSTYTVVWHPLQFKDVEKHWAKDAINDMGSRMVVNGTGEDRFNPDRDITRAEFAAIIVRALGLKPGMGDNQFTDVKNTDWYADYIRIAADYNLISGYGNGKFGPMDKITREQAMTIIARAMKITGLKVELKDGEIQKLLEAFGDSGKAAQYAKSAIAVCLKAEIVSGRNGKVIAPKDNITRAEVAAVVRRLLQKSELI